MKAFTIFQIILCVLSIVFLALSIFNRHQDTTYLAIALACTLIANLSNLIRNHWAKKH